MKNVAQNREGRMGGGQRGTATEIGGGAGMWQGAGRL